MRAGPTQTATKASMAVSLVASRSLRWSRRAICDFGSALDSGSDAHIRIATTEIPGHCDRDVSVIGMWLLLEQRRRGHELSGLAVAALWNVELTPRLLQ